MKHRFIMGLFTTCTLTLTACQTTVLPAKQPAPVQPQPEKPLIMCTMQYDPVCATIDNNGALRQQTFGNACTARQAHGKIVNMAKGACGANSAQ